LLVRYGDEIVHQRQVERAGHFVLPDALYLIWDALHLGVPLGPPHLGEDRPDRVAGHYLNFRVLLLEIAADAGDGSACTRRIYEVGDLPLRLLPDLGTRGGVVRFGIGVVVELVREDRP